MDGRDRRTPAGTRHFTSGLEDVVCHPVSTGKSRSSGLPAAFGYASDGRYIIAVYEQLDELTVVPVTAYDVHEP
jgi:hypothetical protein